MGTKGDVLGKIADVFLLWSQSARITYFSQGTFNVFRFPQLALAICDLKIKLSVSSVAPLPRKKISSIFTLGSVCSNTIHVLLRKSFGVSV